VRVAVNGAFAHWRDVPRDGDEIALLPPVSGG
jgi:molybdopterin synthase sulfur carrier subunit